MMIRQRLREASPDIDIKSVEETIGGYVVRLGPSNSRTTITDALFPGYKTSGVTFNDDSGVVSVYIRQIRQRAFSYSIDQWVVIFVCSAILLCIFLLQF